MGASKTITQFSLDCVQTVANREMCKVGQFMQRSPDELSEEELLAIKWDDLKQTVRAKAPTVWSLLRRCSWTVKQHKRNTMKDPDSTILYMIAMASFSRSNRNSLCQRLIAIYLKSCGTSAKAFDTLHALGITMSQKWTYQGLEILSHRAHQTLLADMQQYPWFLAHDNLNFRFRVFEQRVDHHSHFDSGTAGTVFIIKNPSAVPPTSAAFQAHRAVGCKSPLSSMDIVKLDMFLLDAPNFSFDTYSQKDSSWLKPPPRPGQLKTGANTKTIQYMLDTVHIEEASYEGNDRVIAEWFRQLHLDTPDEKKRTGQERDHSLGR
ncbi:hypothetical protein A0H81_03664 [Grifola frondosa]|uniref:DUF6589 domain-containing protein n=1 Tax=Grifola frondosa TaxID=5627 RepID=A0A1C7MIY2_GRIFR|nr:hypothetical protein A0H81_03664 [Grifola frondosa]